jgi:hypothetical protein
VGDAVGLRVGFAVGTGVGLAVGRGVGSAVGAGFGEVVGLDVKRLSMKFWPVIFWPPDRVTGIFPSTGVKLMNPVKGASNTV